MTSEQNKMRADWDERARENVFCYIALAKNKLEFDASGERDVIKLLSDLGTLVHKDMVVLDLGCGAGRMLKFLAPGFKEVHGMDVSPAMINLAKERLQKFRNVVLHVGNGYDLSGLKDNYFDFVFSWITFQHIPKKVTFGYFNEVFRVLKCDGLFKFQIIHKEGIDYRFKIKWWVSRIRHHEFNPRWWLSLEPPDDDTITLRIHNKKDLSDRLKSIGFEIISMKSDFASLYITAKKVRNAKMKCNATRMLALLKETPK